MDPTRKDAGNANPKLMVLIELDPITSQVAVQTNIVDPALLMRLLGQGMHIWSDNRMKQQLAMMGKQRNGRPLVLPPRGD